MSILGTRVLRREDPDLLTGGASYVDDLQPENLAYVTYLTSPIAHARIRSIDMEAAKAAPGVLGVFIAADLPFLQIEGQLVKGDDAAEAHGDVVDFEQSHLCRVPPPYRLRAASRRVGRVRRHRPKPCDGRHSGAAKPYSP